jgi:quercetin dioxygenase-like cupin family protein
MTCNTWRAVVVILVCAAVSAVGAAISSGSTRQAANSQRIAITRSGTQPSSQGSAQYFTGTARIQPLFEANEPSRANGASVTFEPGARTAWHTHPLGQTLIVTAGAGRVARWGEPAQAIGRGDVVWIPPGQKHWHGASRTTELTHIAIQEHVGGKNVDWLEHVTDEQYGK